jgi:hypothetical protein
MSLNNLTAKDFRTLEGRVDDVVLEKGILLGKQIWPGYLTKNNLVLIKSQWRVYQDCLSA